ncbi:MAG: ComEC/Rec2 family competence protein [Clostridia bacterium]|nr:ComEC/Rec2 family competence protein [Clostridia bacterium]
MSMETASVAMSVMTGDTSDLSDENKQAFQKAGMSHLMAVSGAHVSFILKPVMSMLKKIRFNKHGIVTKNIFLIPFVFFMAFVSGFTPSVIRAALMCLCKIFALVFKRRYDGLNAAANAGLISLAANPFNVFDTGFILSYGACISMYVISPKIKKKAADLKRPVKLLIKTAASGVSVNAGLLPVMINTFNGFSFSGIILNMFASPVAELICTASFVTVLADITGLSGFCCCVAAYPVETASRVLNIVASGAANGILGYQKIASVSITVVLVYYCILAYLFICKKERKLFAICSSICVLLCFLISMPSKAEFLFIDVGQGTAVLFKTRDGYTGLIDTGDGDTDVSSLLFKEEVDKLDFVILSHGHNDHYGGLVEVLEEHRTDIIFIPGNETDVKALEYGSYPGVKTVKVESKISVQIGKYTEMILHCYNDNGYSNINNSSVIASFSGDWGSVILQGDIE